MVMAFIGFDRNGRAEANGEDVRNPKYSQPLLSSN